MQAHDSDGKGELHPYPVMVVVGVGTLLAAMAGSTVNLALPDLGRDLGLSIEDSRWVVLAFLLATGVMMIPIGRLSDLLGHRRLYLGGFVLFGAASVGCGLVDDFGWLIGLRALQGVGGAMAMATGPALLTTSFPARMRGRALGMVATATYVGLTIGPSLGGGIVAWLDWRWTFFINGPVALIVLVLGWAYLPKVPARGGRFDWPGAVALVAGLSLVLLTAGRAGQWGLAAWQTWAAGLGGAVLLVGFVVWQRRTSAPLLDLGLFRSRIFTGAVLSAVANYVALFGVMIMVPFFLEEGLGLMPDRSGMLMMATPAVMALVASPSGWLSDRVGTRGLSFVGLLVMGAGVFGLSRLDGSSGQAAVVAWLAVTGLGTGIFISPNSSALMGAAPRAQQGVAGSLLAEARVVGMLLGVALVTAVFRAGGGQTGQAWSAAEFSAFSTAELAAAGAAVLGAAAALLRGRAGKG